VPNLSKGNATAFSSETPLSRFFGADGKSLLFSSRWAGESIAVRVPAAALPSDMQESDIRETVFSLVNQLDGRSNMSERVNQAKQLISNANSPRDAVPWDAALDGNGHFAGVYKKKSTLADAARPSEYFIAVHTDSGVLGEALSEFVLRRPQMTVGDLLRSPQYEVVTSCARRAAERIAAEIADALNLSRDLVPRKTDTRAANPAGNLARPELIRDVHARTCYNYLHQTAPGSSSIVYYNHTQRLHHGDSPRIVQLKNAKSGISILGLSAESDYHAPRHTIVASGRGSFEVSEGNPYAAFPVGTGRHPIATNGLAELTAEDARAMLASYTWRDRGTKSYEHDFSKAPRQLYGYRRVDAATESMHGFMLGKHDRTDLVPVAAIISGGGL
jgi:hypothetical protein